MVNHDVAEEDIVEMVVPKHNHTLFNTGMAMFHLRSDEAVASALTLKGTYIGDRWVVDWIRVAEGGREKRAQHGERACPLCTRGCKFWRLLLSC